MSEKQPSTYVDFGGHSRDAVLLAKSILPKSEGYQDIHEFDMDTLHIGEAEHREEARARYKKIGEAIIKATVNGDFGEPVYQDDKIQFHELSKVKEEKARYDHRFEEPLNQKYDKAKLEKPWRIAKYQRKYENLKNNTFDISNPEQNEGQLAQFFPSGNYLYHGLHGNSAGSGSSRAIEIMETGALKNGKALRSDDPNKKLNGGYEGISWSMNGIDAFPGDRYHAVGFLGAIENVLDDNEQLAVPSNPAIYEVQQLSRDIDMRRLWGIKKQANLARDALHGPTNRGEIERRPEENNLSSAVTHIVAANHGRRQDKTRVQSWLEKNSENDIAQMLRTNPSGKTAYQTNADGKIVFDPYITNYTGDNLPPVGARYIQALVDTKRFDGTEFDGKTTNEIVEMLNDKNVRAFIEAAKTDMAYWQARVREEESKVTDVRVPVEKLFFVCAKKDLIKWAKVIAACEHQPKGILTYDDDKIKIADWKRRYSDGKELASEIENAIGSHPDKIPYDDVLGEKFDDQMRVKAKGRYGSIAEKYLKKTKAIVLKFGKPQLQ